MYEHFERRTVVLRRMAVASLVTLVAVAAAGATARAAQGNDTGGTALPVEQAAALLERADGYRAEGLEEGVFTFRVTRHQRSGSGELLPPQGPSDVAVIRVFFRSAAAGSQGSEAGQAGQLVIFDEPAGLRGQSFLVVGSNTWMYRPGLRTPLRISAQQRVFGDAGVGEAAGILFSADYTVTEAREETLDGSPSWRLDLEARSRSAPYRRATVWIDRQQGRYRRAILYSVSGVPLKQLEYEQWGEVSGRKALVRMAVRDLLQGAQGTVTLIETVAIRARTIPARYFRPDFLSSAALLLGE